MVKLAKISTNQLCLIFATFVLFAHDNFALCFLVGYATSRIPQSLNAGRFALLEKFFRNNLERKYTQRISSLGANPRNIAIAESGFFSKELTRHTLLTASDEFELARQYKVGVQVRMQEQLLTQQLGRAATDQEVASALDIPARQVLPLMERGEEAKQMLVSANMRLVFHMARFYKYRGVAYPDLVQEGTFGLMRAVGKYDPDKGFRFSTYASWWIKQAVSRAVAEKSRIIRLPVHIHDLMVSISKVERLYLNTYARKPTALELAERLALPLQKVELLLRCSRDVKSIDEELYSSSRLGSTNSDVRVKDRIQSSNADPSLLNERNSLRSELRRVMMNLSPREALIVDMRYGLAGGSPHTLEEIGRRFNVTRERIRQIEARALSKMRNPTPTAAAAAQLGARGGANGVAAQGASMATGADIDLRAIFQDHSHLISSSLRIPKTPRAVDRARQQQQQQQPQPGPELQEFPPDSQRASKEPQRQRKHVAASVGSS